RGFVGRGGELGLHGGSGGRSDFDERGDRRGRGGERRRRGEAGLRDRGGDRALLRGREVDAAAVGLEVAVAEAVDEADLRARLVEVLLRGVAFVGPHHHLVVLGHLAVGRIAGDAGGLRGRALLAG